MRLKIDQVWQSERSIKQASKRCCSLASLCLCATQTYIFFQVIDMSPVSQCYLLGSNIYQWQFKENLKLLRFNGDFQFFMIHLCFSSIALLICEVKIKGTFVNKFNCVCFVINIIMEDSINLSSCQRLTSFPFQVSTKLRFIHL